MSFTVRVRDPETRFSERFEDIDEASERFAELCEEHRAARVSLYGPGGLLVRRRPPNDSVCRFCDQPSAGTWPVTGLGSDMNTRTHDVFALCPDHHATISRAPSGFAAGGLRWLSGHSLG